MREVTVEEKYLPTLGKPSYMIVGLPDAGLVGVIATEFLVNKLNMKSFASLKVRDNASIAYIDDSVAVSPFQFYHDSNLVVFHSWVAIPSHMADRIASVIVEYAEKLGVSTIISLTGVPVPNRLDLDKLNMYYIVNDESLKNELSAFEELKPFGRGYMVGPYAPLLLEAKAKGLKNFAIVVESFLDLPDPEASATALQFIAKYVGISLDTGELLQEAEEIRAKIKGLMEQTKEEMRNYMSGRGPLTYT